MLHSCPFHTSHKAHVLHNCEEHKHENFYLSIWYIEDSKIDFKNKNTAHGNRLLLDYRN